MIGRTIIIPQDRTIFISAAHGSNTSGKIGRRDFPFQTYAAAVVAPDLRPGDKFVWWRQAITEQIHLKSFSANLSSIARTGGTVTAVLATAIAGLAAGMRVLVSGVSDVALDGRFVLSTVSGTTLTWKQAGANIASIATSGKLSACVYYEFEPGCEQLYVGSGIGTFTAPTNAAIYGSAERLAPHSLGSRALEQLERELLDCLNSFASSQKHPSEARPTAGCCGHGSVLGCASRDGSRGAFSPICPRTFKCTAERHRPGRNFMLPRPDARLILRHDSLRTLSAMTVRSAHECSGGA